MNSIPELIRINKYIAHQGICSRRQADELIRTGRVKINGDFVRDMGTKIDPSKDEVQIDGEVIETIDQLLYIALNKPVDYLSTVADDQGRPTVIHLLRQHKHPHHRNWPKVWPVGRLDRDSHGLILLTNDGDLTHKLTHPKYHIPKTYQVIVNGHLDNWKIHKLKFGVQLKDGLTKPADVDILKTNKASKRHILQITLYEGKHRQIRRMCSAIKLEVVDLLRTAIGPIQLGELEPKDIRILSKNDVTMLNNQFND